ncbi:helix-turn-helix domain-containing protein [Cohnella sp. CFH 77786]|uniref:sugar-binding transcriptional regulator n=1 Tax=Cohnella sp. CFH 77786 TaxID=2662265 RepID=UPI001C609B98|nr:sugar-binding transcriptional regulator [Cohnella sp. CFH 77786]MBW5445074.1 helix-turn-helix domain-containing protein [Cohnella sp. CFH 77786]
MDNDKIKKALEAAKLYYQLDYSQSQIAELLGVSRPTVSRLLQQAKAEGIVRIEIRDPTEDVESLQAALKDKFGLRDAIVANTPTYEDELVKKCIGQAAADYLGEILRDGDTIGASWGSTMYQVARHLKSRTLKNSFVVQLNGGVSDADVRISPSEIVHRFAQAFHVTPYFMYLPAIVDHTLVKQAMLSDRHIRRVMDMGVQANVAVFTAGAPTPDSVLLGSNYFREDELEAIRARGAGDICSRYFDENGEICLPELNDRTVGIELADLRGKEHAILVAGGAAKVNAIFGALQGRYGNTLITDQITARELLDKWERRESITK